MKNHAFEKQQTLKFSSAASYIGGVLWEKIKSYHVNEIFQRLYIFSEDGP